MSSVLLDISEQVGLDRIDREVVAWIRDGVYDGQVLDRAGKLNHSLFDPNAGMLQSIHSVSHPDGPYGYEFCARCDGNRK